MLATSQKPRSARVHFLVTAAVCLGFASTGGAVAATTDSLVAWAEHAAPQATYDVEWSVATTVADHFGSVPYTEWRGGRKHYVAFEHQNKRTASPPKTAADAQRSWLT